MSVLSFVRYALYVAFPISQPFINNLKKEIPIQSRCARAGERYRKIYSSVDYYVSIYTIRGNFAEGNSMQINDIIATRIAQKNYAFKFTETRTDISEISDTSEREKVDFSAKSIRLQANAQIITTVLSDTERIVDLPEDAYITTGKTHYLRSMETLDNVSPEATSQRILDGITGYIYRAWKTQNPDATAEDFEGFRQQIEKGVAQGVEEAREILLSMQTLTPEIDSGITETVAHLTKGLNAFFEAEQGHYLSFSA